MDFSGPALDSIDHDLINGDIDSYLYENGCLARRERQLERRRLERQRQLCREHERLERWQPGVF